MGSRSTAGPAAGFSAAAAAALDVGFEGAPPSVSTLQAAIESVEKQLYENWELCIVDDASSREETIAYLKTLRHPRIRTRFLENNRNISGATNEAIRFATGEYLAFMDNDDELTPEQEEQGRIMKLEYCRENCHKIGFYEQVIPDEYGGKDVIMFRKDSGPGSTMNCINTMYSDVIEFEKKQDSFELDQVEG